MAGNNSIRGDQTITFTDNLSFDGTERNGMDTNGQLWIGATSSDRANNGGHVRKGMITSPDSSLTIGYSAPNITIVANGSKTGQTITGDSGGALSPTGGNWNILGLSGSKTSGNISTLTVKSPPYSDQGGSTTVTLNSGSFATAAITLTLPASAGLADGDLFEFVCTSSSALVIQSVGSQKIRIGTLLSSAAGTATSTSIGDSVSLRFRASDGFFYATSVIGTWLIA